MNSSIFNLLLLPDCEPWQDRTGLLSNCLLPYTKVDSPLHLARFSLLQYLLDGIDHNRIFLDRVIKVRRYAQQAGP